ncbi:PREDICTED: uncharacterized protein LOC108364787 [Rhagoletis zephyria]|uniref:uncharacterized protein LOC108364787 n=1 Tax=Rhagoletis zephyria TaxID=28612 RepID=UPI00081135BA|nr:PREDICTED: uncharacterized protein LOC108364787 [Rhagoletis zephyria]
MRDRYHNNKMVNYDSQEGFSVISTTVADTTVDDDLHIFSEKYFIGIGKKFNSDLQMESKANGHYTEKPLRFALKPQQSPYLVSPTSSILTLEVVHFHHAGNYTCAPSNAKSVSITVHVLRGK